MIKPELCPNCGSTNIGVKDGTVTTPWKKEARKVWGYCRSCGLKGTEEICDININDDNEIDRAYKAWNENKKQSGL